VVLVKPSHGNTYSTSIVGMIFHMILLSTC